MLEGKYRIRRTIQSRGNLEEAGGANGLIVLFSHCYRNERV